MLAVTPQTNPGYPAFLDKQQRKDETVPLYPAWAEREAKTLDTAGGLCLIPLKPPVLHIPRFPDLLFGTRIFTGGAFPATAWAAIGHGHCPARTGKLPHHVNKVATTSAFPRPPGNDRAALCAGPCSRGRNSAHGRTIRLIRVYPRPKSVLQCSFPLAGQAEPSTVARPGAVGLEILNLQDLALAAVPCMRQRSVQT